MLKIQEEITNDLCFRSGVLWGRKDQERYEGRSPEGRRALVGLRVTSTWELETQFLHHHKNRNVIAIV